MTPASSPNSRVALFCTDFLPYSQTFVYEELRNHARYSADVFCRVRLNPERFPYERTHQAEWHYPYTRRSARFDRAFEQNAYCLVHAHFGPAGIYARGWAARHALPLLVTFHGYDVAFLHSRQRYHPRYWRYVLGSPALFATLTLGLCASTELRDLLVRAGCPSEKVRVHRLGIDVDAFAPAGDRADVPQVIMVGRFVPKKGFEYGLRAFAEIARRFPAARLVLVGDGELRAHLESLTRRLRLRDRVRFAGALAPAAVREELRRSDVLLAPSIVDADGNRESGLIVAKEASACEVVPIGSHHGGIPDIIDDGETGFLVGERDVGAMARRLAELLGDPALRRRQGQAARAKMLREYDNRRCVEHLESFYDEARRIGPGRAP